MFTHVVLLFFLNKIPWKLNKSWNYSCLLNHHENVCQVKRLCSPCHELLALAESLWHLPNLLCLQFSKQYSEQIKIYICTIKKKMAEEFLCYLFGLLHLFQLNTKKSLCWGKGMGCKFQRSNTQILPCYREHETMHRLKLLVCGLLELKSIPISNTVSTQLSELQSVYNPGF